MAFLLINPPDVHEPIMPYSHAVKVDKTIYISAQLPLDREGNLVGVGDAAAQAEQVFRNLEAVLKAAGATLNDVVKLTTYLTSLDYRPAVMETRNRFFGNTALPASWLWCGNCRLPVRSSRWTALLW